MKNKHQHICKFNKTCSILDARYPPYLKSSKIKRKFREFFLISEENCRKCFTPMGVTGYIFEKEKQLTQHPLIIHPYSKFCHYWESFMMVEIFLSLLIRPLIVSQFAWTAIMKPEYQAIALCADLLEMLDVGLRFFVGYLDPDTRASVLEFPKIFSYNIRRFSFYIRLITSLPLEFAVYLFALVNGFPHSLFLFCIFLKIFHLLTLNSYLRHMVKIYNWSEFCSRCVWIVLNMVLIHQWLACFFYLGILNEEFRTNEENDFVYKGGFFFRHVVVMYLVCNTFFYEIGFYSSIRIIGMKDMLISGFVLIMVNFSCIIFAAMFVQLLGLLKTSRIQYAEMIQEVRKFLSQENLPKRVHKKVEKYFQFRFWNVYFREERILETLSPPLRREIAAHLCLNLLLNGDSILNGVSTDMAESLCQHMVFEMFLPGDEIIRAERRATKLYFLYCGSVAVYSPVGKEMMHLYEGQHFGVSAFLSYNTYVVTVIALEMTECYVLQQSAFLKCISEFPNYEDKVVGAASRKRKSLKRMYS